MKSRRIGLVLLSAVMALSLSCSAKGSGNGKSTEGKPDSPRLTIFFTGELKGTIEPCGCTTDPLGDLARTTRLIESTRKGGPVLHIDAGSLLYTHNPIPPDLARQEKLKADLLVDVFEKRLNPAAIGLGPFDLSKGPKGVRLTRMAANVPASTGVPLEPPKVVESGGVKVGLFGVVSPAAVQPFGVEAKPPGPAASKAAAELRKSGADLVVGIAHMTKAEARTLARELKGVDVLVVGQKLPDKAERVSVAPDRVGDTWLVMPADRGQVVTRLDITMRGEGPLQDAIGKARADDQLAKLEGELKDLGARLEAWDKDKSADQAFVAQKRKELDELQRRKQALAESPLKVPASGPYFVMEQVRIRKKLACDAKIVAKKRAFDQAAGKANLEAAKDDKPVPPGKGEAGYVGTEECSYCHASEVKFWKKTRHAQAWKTLVDGGKEYNRDCVYCHVTGFGKKGGSTLAFTEGLQDIQCETCHGPGSLHVEADGNDEPRTIRRTPEERLCKTCHNEEHSNTFQFEAYLRDVTGSGHAPDFRKKLGDGPTGHELRSAGLEAAGKDIGEGCPK
ncbi:MAG: hypothetical protein KJO07_23045 [Deltaproteobacteria bacterium]|nr:hypothetical protein [Deltaproteobacteria bacterium]